MKSLRPSFCWKWTYRSVMRATTTTLLLHVLPAPDVRPHDGTRAPTTRTACAWRPAESGWEGSCQKRAGWTYWCGKGAACAPPPTPPPALGSPERLHPARERTRSCSGALHTNRRQTKVLLRLIIIMGFIYTYIYTFKLKCINTYTTAMNTFWENWNAHGSINFM